jgi:outer membrane protein assembly factor BamB
MIFVMNDFGVLTLLEASPVGYNQLARAKVLNERDSWGPMVLVNGRLLVRDPKTMVCLDVRKELQ